MDDTIFSGMPDQLPIDKHKHTTSEQSRIMMKVRNILSYVSCEMLLVSVSWKLSI